MCKIFRVIVYILKMSVTNLHHQTKPVSPQTRPQNDNALAYFTKKAFDELLEISLLFPKNGIFKFKTQTKPEVFYWLEYIVSQRISDDKPKAREKYSKSFIIELLTKHRNILLFHKNKRNHPKVHSVFSNSDIRHWLILVDENSGDEHDLSSLGVLVHHNMCLLTLDELKDFLTVNKIKDSKTNQFIDNTEVPTTADPLRAGLFSRAKHRVERMKRHFKKPQDKSVSRTSTFTRRNVRPEEYIKDPEFEEENKIRFQQLANIANKQSGSRNTNLLNKYKAYRKKANAKSLLALLMPKSKISDNTLTRNDAYSEQPSRVSSGPIDKAQVAEKFSRRTYDDSIGDQQTQLNETEEI